MFTLQTYDGEFRCVISTRMVIFCGIFISIPMIELTAEQV